MTNDLPHRLRAVAVPVIALLGAALLGAGCGNLTAGGASEVESVIAADDSEQAQTQQAEAFAPSASPSASPSGAPEGALGRLDPAGHLLDPGDTPDPAGFLALGLFEGTLRVTVALHLIGADGGVHALTQGAQEVALPLAQGARTAVGLVEMPAGEYAGLRATFSRLEAEVDAAPGQAPFPGVVELDLSEGPVEVESSAAVHLGEGQRVRVVVDLRAGAWVVTPGLLAPATLRSAIRFRVEPAD